MAANTWPASLPQQMVEDGFEQSLPDNLVRSQPDVGPALVRRKTLANVAPVTGAVLVDGAQLETLVLFFVTTLQSGALRFNWANPRTGAACEMRFTAPPKWAKAGGPLWRVSLSLEIMP